MAPHRSVLTSTWKDDRFHRLPESVRYIYIALMESADVDYRGALERSPDMLAADIRCPASRVSEALEVLAEAEYIVRHKYWIVFLEFRQNQMPRAQRPKQDHQAALARNKDNYPKDVHLLLCKLWGVDPAQGTPQGTSQGTPQSAPQGTPRGPVEERGDVDVDVDVEGDPSPSRNPPKRERISKDDLAEAKNRLTSDNLNHAWIIPRLEHRIGGDFHAGKTLDIQVRLDRLAKIIDGFAYHLDQTREDILDSAIESLLARFQRGNMTGKIWLANFLKDNCWYALLNQVEMKTLDELISATESGLMVEQLGQRQQSEAQQPIQPTPPLDGDLFGPSPNNATYDDPSR